MERLVRLHAESATRGTVATITAIRFYSGTPSPAALVELRSSMPARALLQLRTLVDALVDLWAPSTLSVAYRLRDTRGGTVWVAGSYYNGGFVWTRPDLVLCQPIFHTIPISRTPPPRCPVDIAGHPRAP
jgi:hypothetical protein